MASSMQPPADRPIVRSALSWTLAFVALALLVQVYLAGSALLGGADYDATMGIHIGLGHAMEMLAVLVTVLGFVARDRPAAFGGIALVVLTFAQNGFINAEGALRAFHVVGAMLIVGIVVWLLTSRLPFGGARPAPVR